MVAILGETEELIKIFYTSIRTAQKNPETESTWSSSLLPLGVERWTLDVGR